MGGLMVMSNVLATKIWGFELFGHTFTFDAGIITLPFVCVGIDVLNEVFGKRVADIALLACCEANGLVILLLVIADYLPTVAGIENVDFSAVLGLSLRVFLASITAFVAGGLVNNYIFAECRRRRIRRSFATLGWLTSLLGRIVDAAIFTPIAFAGRLSIRMMFVQAICGLTVAMLIEAVLYLVVGRLLARYE